MIGVLGGSFDPVHFGHLRPALEVMQQLELPELRFMPAAFSPFKQQSAIATEHRLEMLRLAISGVEGFVLDERETLREGPSWTIDSVTALRREMPRETMVFITGADAFSAFRQWRAWRDILENVHLLVTHRPGAMLDMSSWPVESLADDRQSLLRYKAGKIMQLEITQLDISSSHIRSELKKGKNIRFLLPDRVCDYIVNNQLYNDQPPIG